MAGTLTGAVAECLPFFGVLGQDGPRALLLRAIRSGRLAHSFLFLGPDGTGRRALALELARVLSCPKGVEASAAEPCDCHSCRAMRKWHHPNLLPIFPVPRRKPDGGVAATAALTKLLVVLAQDIYNPLNFTSATARILLDEVHNARDSLLLAPDRPGVRTVIIYPAERLNDQASNALLKLLEEPPERCLLILIATSSRDLLPTIVSRCQQILFAPLPTPVVAEGLMERRGLPPEKARDLAPLALGNFTRALQLENQRAEALIEGGIAFLRAAATGNALKITEVIERWSAEEASRGEGSREEASREEASRSEIQEQLSYTALWLLDALLTLASKEGGVALPTRIPGGAASVARMAERYDAERLQAALREVEEARLTLDANVNVSLALTALAIKIRRVLR